MLAMDFASSHSNQNSDFKNQSAIYNIKYRIKAELIQITLNCVSSKTTMLSFDCNFLLCREFFLSIVENLLQDDDCLIDKIFEHFISVVRSDLNSTHIGFSKNFFFTAGISVFTCKSQHPKELQSIFFDVISSLVTALFLEKFSKIFSFATVLQHNKMCSLLSRKIFKTEYF